MGARSRQGKKGGGGGRKTPAHLKREHPPAGAPTQVTAAVALPDASGVVGEAQGGSGSADSSQIRAPPCATRLFQTQLIFAELEESCADIRYFALKPKTHAQLKRCGVPVKLAEILLFQDVTDSAPAVEKAEARVHKGAVYAHIAAAEALRNLIANDDAASAGTILTLLTMNESAAAVAAASGTSSPANGSDASGASSSSTSFSVRLAMKLTRVWELAVAAHRTARPEEWLAEQQEQQPPQEEGGGAAAAEAGEEEGEEGEEDEEGDADKRAGRPRPGSAYLVLLRLVEELLLLACLCVDGSATTADIFAALPSFLSVTLLPMLHAAVTTSFQNVRHPADYFEPASPTATAMVAAMRYMKQEESKGLARVAVAAADLLRTLSEESETVAASLLPGSGCVPGEQLASFTDSPDGAALLAWLQDFNRSGGDPATLQRMFGWPPSSLPFDEKSVYFQLIQAYLHMHGALLNATSAFTSQQLHNNTSGGGGGGRNALQKVLPEVMSTAATNVKKMLPLLSAVAFYMPPMKLWSSVLPLLMRDESLLAMAAALHRGETGQQQQQQQCSGEKDNLLLYLFALHEAREHRKRSAEEEEEEAAAAASSNGAGDVGEAGEEEGFLLPEAARASAVQMATAQLRCTQAAAKVLLALITFICEQNSVAAPMWHPHTHRGGGGGGSGEEELDDETAFRRNPLSRLLLDTVFTHVDPVSHHAQPVNVLVVFGSLLKDLLWLNRGTGGSASSAAATDVMTGGLDNGVAGDFSSSSSSEQQQQRLLQQEQRLLTRFTDENAEVTTIQFILLSTEVAVWQSASSLLLMLPVESLGTPHAIWRSIIAHVHGKHQRIVETTATADMQGGDVGFLSGEEGGDHRSAEETAATAVLSPAVHQLLWMHLEPLTTILWTMLRKNQKRLQSGEDNPRRPNQIGDGSGAELLVHPQPSDVDLLTRLFWETKAEAAVKQSCVAAVGLLCSQMGTVDAVTVGARFAMAVLSRATAPQLLLAEQAMFGVDGGDGAQGQRGSKTGAASTLPSQAGIGKEESSRSGGTLTVLQLGRGIVAQSTAPPTQPQARRQWLRLLTAVDAVVSVRCEAANALIDLFLDERFDATVYAPLQVQAALTAFHAPLRQYLKKRAQLAKEVRKHYKMVLDGETEAEQWAEVEENLSGFLPYKAANVRV